MFWQTRDPPVNNDDTLGTAGEVEVHLEFERAIAVPFSRKLGAGDWPALDAGVGTAAAPPNALPTEEACGASGGVRQHGFHMGMGTGQCSWATPPETQVATALRRGIN